MTTKLHKLTDCYVQHSLLQHVFFFFFGTSRNLFCLISDLVDPSIPREEFEPRQLDFEILTSFLSEQDMIEEGTLLNLAILHRGIRITVNNNMSFRAAIMVLKQQQITMFKFVVPRSSRPTLSGNTGRLFPFRKL